VCRATSYQTLDKSGRDTANGDGNINTGRVTRGVDYKNSERGAQIFMVFGATIPSQQLRKLYSQITLSGDLRTPN